MDRELLAAFGIPLVVFVVAVTIGYALGKRKHLGGLSTIGVLLVVVTVWLFVGLGKAQGYDGLAYIFALIGLDAPAALGMLIGGGVGWVRQRKEQDA